MKIYAIRHTQPEIEPGICYGQSDLNVAHTFSTERETIAEQIKGIAFDRIYSSPLLRCKILAESLFPKKEIVFEKRLKELNFGDWELKSWDDIYASKHGKLWMDNYQILATLNGESYLDMEERITSFWSDLKARKDKQVVIVAHAGVIRILKSLIEDVPISQLFEDFKPAYGSVTEFDID